MATFLDLSGLEDFSKFFVFLFVWLIVYALLQYNKILGDNQGISAIAGLIVGLFVLFSPLATGLIQFISPWFAIIFVFAIFAAAGMKVMGANQADVMGGNLKLLVSGLIIIVLIIGALGYVRSQVSVPGDNETEADYTDTSAVLFHPSVLGGIFIMLVAVFTIALLAARPR